MIENNINVGDVVRIAELSVVTSILRQEPPYPTILYVLTADCSVTSICSSSVGKTGYTIDINTLLSKLQASKSLTEDPSATKEVGRVVRFLNQYGVITKLHRRYDGGICIHILYANGRNTIVPPEEHKLILPCEQKVDIESIITKLESVRKLAHK